MLSSLNLLARYFLQTANFEGELTPSQDRFKSVQAPFTWPGGNVVPGGVLMALAANAAYSTVPTDFALDTLSAHFLAGPRASLHLDIAVQRIKDGGRFIHRVVTITQAQAIMVHVTCSFNRRSSMLGLSMTHTSQRQTAASIDEITIDDLAPGRTALGPWMRFQRLAVEYTGSKPWSTRSAKDAAPADLTYTFAAQVASPIDRDDVRTHALGLLALSDYHVLDCPPTLHTRHLGQARIGDVTQTRTPNDMTLMTSLNHSIQFRIHAGFQADDLLFVEATSAWAGERRAEISTKIFDRDGRLLATCKQEGYYVLRDDAKL